MKPCAYRKLCRCRCWRRSDEVDSDPAKQRVKQKDTITKFLSGPFNSAVQKCRYLFLVAFLIVGFFAAFTANNMGPLKEPEQFIPEDDSFIQFQIEVEENFLSEGANFELL